MSQGRFDDILVGHRTRRGIEAALAHDGIIPGLVAEAAGRLFERKVRGPVDQAEFYLLGVTVLLDALEVGPGPPVFGLEHDPVDVEAIEIEPTHTQFVQTLLQTIDPLDMIGGWLRRAAFEVAPPPAWGGPGHRVD